MKKILFYCILGVLLGNAAGISVSEAEIRKNNVVVPNVRGISQDVAAQILATTGLKVRVQRDSSRSSLVATQAPAPGTLLPVGSEVVISTGTISVATISPPTVSSIPPEQNKTVLNFPPQSPSSTVTTTEVRPMMAWYPNQFLTQKQPQRSFVSRSQVQSDQPSNILLSARPSSAFGQGTPLILSTTGGWNQGWVAGDRSSATSTNSSVVNSPVILGNSSNNTGGTATVPVPKVIRLPLADASAALNKLGLSVGAITQIEDFRLKSGLVLKQSPQARKLVPVGTQIQLWIVK